MAKTNTNLLLPTVDKRCGTNNGYVAHQRRKEISCDACREAVKEYNKTRRMEHPLAYKEYYSRNRGKVLARVKASTEKHYGKRVAYRTRTVEHIRVRNKNWRESNKDISNMHSRSRRAKTRGVESERYTEKQVLEKYGLNCHLCGEPIDLNAPRQIQKGEGWQLGLHLDHDLPLSLGGPDTLENVKPSHAICNLKKRRKSHLLLYT